MPQDVPIHLAGNNIPVAEEATLVPSRIVGQIPDGLSGTFIRNGPNARTGHSPHWFAGDGMVHAVCLRDGNATWYRNRFIRTPLYKNPTQSRYALALDPQTGDIDYRVNTANTHIVEHAGRLLALEEGGLPYALTALLDTVGPYTFDGALKGPMTAHPKSCPLTGDLLFFGYRLRPPFLTYYRADSQGILRTSLDIDLPAAVMMHDFAITAEHVVFMDLPVVFDVSAAAAGAPPWRWDPYHQARFGVMSRRDEAAPIRWFDVDSCFVWHTMNAYEAGGAIVITGTRVESLWRQGPDDVTGGMPTLHRWTLNLTTGAVTETPLDDTASEYPRISESVCGQPHRFGYTTSFALQAEPNSSEIYKYDLWNGTRTTFRFPQGHSCGEAVFVPSTDIRASEDDGYLMTFVHDGSDATSYLVILDAADPLTRPIAEIHLPVRIPNGFHGNWIPSRAIGA
ncbi:carotenoid oxygenase family protein [Mycobacterium sp. 050128]|uniref:carotenoid oxygenase family protein n=1 Tax=Mycobacterium sp. 050128 TaxID=3096112 RepID=UPI002ED7E414